MYQDVSPQTEPETSQNEPAAREPLTADVRRLLAVLAQPRHQGRASLAKILRDAITRRERYRLLFALKCLSQPHHPTEDQDLNQRALKLRRYLSHFDVPAWGELTEALEIFKEDSGTPTDARPTYVEPVALPARPFDDLDLQPGDHVRLVTKRDVVFVLKFDRFNHPDRRTWIAGTDCRDESRHVIIPARTVKEARRVYPVTTPESLITFADRAIEQACTADGAQHIFEQVIRARGEIDADDAAYPHPITSRDAEVLAQRLADHGYPVHLPEDYRGVGPAFGGH